MGREDSSSPRSEAKDAAGDGSKSSAFAGIAGPEGWKRDSNPAGPELSPNVSGKDSKSWEKEALGSFTLMGNAPQPKRNIKLLMRNKTFFRKTPSLRSRLNRIYISEKEKICQLSNAVIKTGELIYYLPGIIIFLIFPERRGRVFPERPLQPLDDLHFPGKPFGFGLQTLRQNRDHGRDSARWPPSPGRGPGKVL